MARATVVLRPDGSLRVAVDAVPVWVMLPDYRILPLPAADTVPMTRAERLQYARFAEDTRFILNAGPYK